MLGISSGRKTVTAAGTAEALESARREVLVAVITAETDNTGVVVIGGADVIAAQATRKGVPLDAGDSITLYSLDMNRIYIDSTVSGDGVTYLTVT